MSSVWVGTAGYHHTEWNGDIYPEHENLNEQGMLRYYGQHCSSVELKSTCYKMPTARVMQGWRKATPDAFMFSVRAPRLVTHDLCLRDAAEDTADFFDALHILGDKLGTVLFQLPPFLKKDLPRLEDFLHQLPPSVRSVFEFRHQSWIDDAVLGCLRRFEVALCITEYDDSITPFEHTAPFGYLRLRRTTYTDVELLAWAQRLQEVGAQWGDIFIYFKHDDPKESLRYARQLQSMLSDEAPTVAPVAPIQEPSIA